ncbi:unnamed protein product, partial [Mesorhabditis belari]|uniref:EGF-like domain-containing protein n=1 Tax=Mesorhabditis belari TaxID=2138241 RepID=A0AAF3EE36_9BILA
MEKSRRLGSCSESQQESVHPFIDQLYQDFRQHFQPKWNGKRAQFVEQHLGLQTWHCNSKRSTIIKMGKGLSDDVERYLVEHQVAELYARIATDRLRGDHLNEMPIGLRKLREHIRSEIYSNYWKCQNDGVYIGGDVCNCKPYFYGIVCENRICMNGGHNYGNDPTQRCVCPPGFIGRHCEPRSCSGDGKTLRTFDPRDNSMISVSYVLSWTNDIAKKAQGNPNDQVIQGICSVFDQGIAEVYIYIAPGVSSKRFEQKADCDAFLKEILGKCSNNGICELTTIKGEYIQKAISESFPNSPLTQNSSGSTGLVPLYCGDAIYESSNNQIRFKKENMNQMKILMNAEKVQENFVSDEICQHGSLYKNSCACNIGWMGASCDVPDCQNDGKVNAGGTCDCPDWTSGLFCEKILNSICDPVNTFAEWRTQIGSLIFVIEESLDVQMNVQSWIDSLKGMNRLSLTNSFQASQIVLVTYSDLLVTARFASNDPRGIVPAFQDIQWIEKMNGVKQEEALITGLQLQLYIPTMTSKVFISTQSLTPIINPADPYILEEIDSSIFSINATELGGNHLNITFTADLNATMCSYSIETLNVEQIAYGVTDELMKEADMGNLMMPNGDHWLNIRWSGIDEYRQYTFDANDSYQNVQQWPVSTKNDDYQIDWSIPGKNTIAIVLNSTQCTYRYSPKILCACDSQVFNPQKSHECECSPELHAKSASESSFQATYSASCLRSYNQRKCLNVNFPRKLEALKFFLLREGIRTGHPTGSFDVYTFKNQLVVHHNMVRARHGCSALQRDYSMDSVAQRWADSLAANEDCLMHERPKNYGENLFFFGARHLVSPDLFAEAVTQSFYQEGIGYDYDRFYPGGYHRVGHFTQLIWRSTKRMGVGIAIRTSTGRGRCIRQSGLPLVYVVVKYDPMAYVLEAVKTHFGRLEHFDQKYDKKQMEQVQLERKKAQKRKERIKCDRIGISNCFAFSKAEMELIKILDEDQYDMLFWILVEDDLKGKPTFDLSLFQHNTLEEKKQFDQYVTTIVDVIRISPDKLENAKDEL